MHNALPIQIPPQVLNANICAYLCITNILHYQFTAYDTGNISETLHIALPTQTPHCKHSSHRSPHLHCAPAMKSVTAQIPRYVMAFVTAYSTVFTDAFLTTQCTGHTDAATTLLAFRLQTTTELLSTQLCSIYTSKQHTALAIWILL
jgi:hypothetical protein